MTEIMGNRLSDITRQVEVSVQAIVTTQRLLMSISKLKERFLWPHPMDRQNVMLII